MICVALLAVIAGLQLAHKTKLRLPAAAVSPVQLASDPDAPAVSSYPGLRAHPAFAPDRAPLPADVDVSGNLNGFEVLGVAMASNTAAALIRDSSGQIVRLKPGQSVQSWRLVSVDRTQLVFDRNGERRTLTLDLNRARMAGAGAGSTKGKSSSDDDDDSSSSSSSDDSDSDDSDN